MVCKGLGFDELKVLGCAILGFLSLVPSFQRVYIQDMATHAALRKAPFSAEVDPGIFKTVMKR